MPVHDDHHSGSGSDDAHVHSLRLVLGSILSPKRPQITRSSTTSGTASPAMHCPHAAIPLTPSHSGSASHPASTPLAHGAHPGHLPHSPHHQPQPHHHPHHHHHQPALPVTAHIHAVNAIDEPHPNIPDAVVSPMSGAVPESGQVTPGGRARFVETLQSNKSWDALIHGSWM